MDFLKENAKAFAGAVAAIFVVCTKPYWPVVADPTFQPALELIVSVGVVALAVWGTRNKPKE